MSYYTIPALTPSLSGHRLKKSQRHKSKVHFFLLMSQHFQVICCHQNTSSATLLQQFDFITSSLYYLLFISNRSLPRFRPENSILDLFPNFMEGGVGQSLDGLSVCFVGSRISKSFVGSWLA